MELSEFYDFSSSYPDWEDVDEEALDEELTLEEQARLAHGAGATVDEGSMDIVLPSGHRAVHRSLHKYYKQRFTKEDDRDSVRIQRLMSQYVSPNIGWLTQSSRYKAIGIARVEPLTQQQRRERARHLRGNKKNHLRVGMGANNQKHFREQVLV